MPDKSSDDPGKKGYRGPPDWRKGRGLSTSSPQQKSHFDVPNNERQTDTEKYARL